ncbi:MAG: DUF6282 family protein, partial [Candidatus Micrarchaeota archaeon]|nr:DUF6282 family protein [Candidatus Micrarchaeota archaeon]
HETPFVVWFPTIHARNFLSKSKWEVPPEWIGNKFTARKSSEIKGLGVSSKEEKQTAISVLKAIKKHNGIVATGHLSWQEAEWLALESLKMKLPVVLTHPIYQRIDMPIEVQKKLADKGAFVEVPRSMNAIDNIPLSKIVEQIRKVGCDKVILSTDGGQAFSAAPSILMLDFCEKLTKEVFTVEEIRQMIVKNPAELLGL